MADSKTVTPHLLMPSDFQDTSWSYHNKATSRRERAPLCTFPSILSSPKFPLLETMATKVPSGKQPARTPIFYTRSTDTLWLTSESSDDGESHAPDGDEISVSDDQEAVESGDSQQPALESPIVIEISARNEPAALVLHNTMTRKRQGHLDAKAASYVRLKDTKEVGERSIQVEMDDVEEVKRIVSLPDSIC